MVEQITYNILNNIWIKKYFQIYINNASDDHFTCELGHVWKVFFFLRIELTYFWANMGQNRFTNLAILNIEKCISIDIVMTLYTYTLTKIKKNLTLFICE